VPLIEGGWPTFVDILLALVRLMWSSPELKEELARLNVMSCTDRTLDIL